MRSLTRNSFKHSIGTYYVTSRESPDQLWIEELSSSSSEVAMFKMRVHDGCDVMSFFSFGDAYEHFLCQWDSKVRLLCFARCTATIHL